MNITTEGKVLFQLTTDAEKDAMSHLSDYLNTVPYTNLTLPTNREVYNLVDAVSLKKKKKSININITLKINTKIPYLKLNNRHA